MVSLALAACGEADAPKRENLLFCQPAGAAEFKRICLIERDQGPDGLRLTLRHPDGRFRRLLATKDGRGVIAADGAEQAVVTVNGKSEIMVALGGDRYRLPARIAPR